MTKVANNKEVIITSKQTSPEARGAKNWLGRVPTCILVSEADGFSYVTATLACCCVTGIATLLTAGMGFAVLILQSGDNSASDYYENEWFITKITALTGASILGVATLCCFCWKCFTKDIDAIDRELDRRKGVSDVFDV